MRYAICNEMFKDWAFDRICRYVRSLGYEGLEIAPFTLAGHVDRITPRQRQEIRQTAAEAGVEILGLHWLLANVVSPVPLYVTHPDAAVRKDTADYFMRLTRLCADLGGSVMVIGSPKQRSLLPGVSRAQAMTYAVEVFAPCMESAGELGVTLAIEPLGPAETDFLNTAAEGIELIERLNHPNFRLHLDVKAMSSESQPIPKIIRESARHLVHFHVNDPNLRGPGMGEVDHRPIIAALREVAYDGWLSVETFDTTVPPETMAEESVRYLKQVC